MIPAFPSTGAIPPACFYNSQGLAEWLNKNPEYKVPFAFTGAFQYLYPPNLLPSTFSTIGYTAQKVPLCSNVTTLSQKQAQEYGRQLQLFQKVYAFNSNAYVNALANNTAPVYYNFATYKEKYEYNSAVQLVNKMYPFQAMAEAPGVNWQIPFPIGI